MQHKHEDQKQPGEDTNTRPQQGGEAATTRFGMEDGDNTDVPATGQASEDDEDSGPSDG